MAPNRKKFPHVVHINVPRNWFETNSRHQDCYSEDGKLFRGCRARSTGKSRNFSVKRHIRLPAGWKHHLAGTGYIRKKKVTRYKNIHKNIFSQKSAEK